MYRVRVRNFGPCLLRARLVMLSVFTPHPCARGKAIGSVIVIVDIKIAKSGGLGD